MISRGIGFQPMNLCRVRRIRSSKCSTMSPVHMLRIVAYSVPRLAANRPPLGGRITKTQSPGKHQAPSFDTETRLARVWVLEIDCSPKFGAWDLEFPSNAVRWLAYQAELF